jgi:hypothetical protein
MLGAEVSWVAQEWTWRWTKSSPHVLCPANASSRKIYGAPPQWAGLSTVRSRALAESDRANGHGRGPLGNSLRGGCERNVRTPATCALRQRAHSERDGGLFGCVRRRRTLRRSWHHPMRYDSVLPEASAPTRSADDADWPPTSSVLRLREPTIRAAADGSSSPRPPPRPDASTAAWRSSQAALTPRRTTSRRAELPRLCVPFLRRGFLTNQRKPGPAGCRWRRRRRREPAPQDWSPVSPSLETNILRLSISFFSSIILSSRPTVNRWNRSSSASRSRSHACRSAISF